MDAWEWGFDKSLHKSPQAQPEPQGSTCAPGTTLKLQQQFLRIEEMIRE